ncbi:MAG: endonuclease/exonuclease/phosphatase family protein [Clostridiales bacterium]|nr:endonuclease/exonuclease/phosphatase family protein [Clostridiales bacterium]
MRKTAKEKLTKKRLALRIVLGVLGALLIIVISYLIYVFASYHRIPDNQVLKPSPDPTTYLAMDRVVERITVEPGDQIYTIMSYNIGFGAYTPDYSFFMDGGKYSWARSKDGLIQNLKDIGRMLESYDPDFVLLQEVDEDGTRTYHVDERPYLITSVDPYQYVFARNFDSPFLFWPLLEPHGANKSGLLTMSRAYISSALRRSLPVSSSLSKILDYDRAYTVTRIPLGDIGPEQLFKFPDDADDSENISSSGKELVIYNVHLSAYGTDASVRDGQVSMLIEDMQSEVEKGNYVICGGDFNHNLRLGGSDNAPDWAQPFPFTKLPDQLAFAYRRTIDRYSILDRVLDEDEQAYIKGIVELLKQRGHNMATVTKHDTCRNADEPYNPDTTFTVMADGFIVSSNVEVIYYENIDLQYAYSDHDPVYMEFRLK